MSKELLDFMTWVNQDKKLGYTSIGIERIVNRYITSKDQIIDEVYENYEGKRQKWENERIDYLIKSEAIDFAKFITNDTTFNDFVFMSKELQEEIYQEFKRENRKL